MEVNELLRDLRHAQFYGSVELKFEAGNVVLIRKTETMKANLENCRGTRGIADDIQQV
jgi:hypothetical protein